MVKVYTKMTGSMATEPAYPSWMLVGEKTGNVLWSWIGKKLSDPNELDPYIVQEVTKQAPNFFTDKAPWTLNSNGWTQYTRERQPSKQDPVLKI